MITLLVLGAALCMGPEKAILVQEALMDLFVLAQVVNFSPVVSHVVFRIGPFIQFKVVDKAALQNLDQSRGHSYLTF